MNAFSIVEKPPTQRFYHCCIPRKKCNEISWFDRHLNPEQRRAVGNILLAQVDGLIVPYIVFGPPGTGKTKTVCEAVLQLCRHRSCTVLVTAPSNTAADLLLEKLSTSLSKTEMLRFMVFNRNPREVSSVNKSLIYCTKTPSRRRSYDDDEGDFVQRSLEDLLRVKVVVAICCMVAKLFNLGLPRKHWDAIFIDEVH
jgi:helicase MOV-10